MFLEIGLLLLLFGDDKKKQPVKTNRNMSYANYKKNSPANNNPGNIIYANPKYYQGGIYNLPNGTIVFNTMQNGIRAVITTLYWYYSSLLKPEFFSIKGIVSKWAPGDDGKNKYLRGNDEGIYTKTLSDLSGLSATELLGWNKEKLYLVIRAMCVQEHGLDAVTATDFNNAWDSLKKTV